MKATIQRINGTALAGKGESNHWVVMDGPEEFGGFSAGTRPMEMILIGLAGCSAMDVLSILKKKRVKLDDFSMRVESERAEEHPKVFTKIHLHYIFTGKAIKPKDVERSIELSQDKYCGASAMLRKAAEISFDYEIIEPE
jgi:putative redox protein